MPSLSDAGNILASPRLHCQHRTGLVQCPGHYHFPDGASDKYVPWVFW
jgi:hypothetical protein